MTGQAQTSQPAKQPVSQMVSPAQAAAGEVGAQQAPLFPWGTLALGLTFFILATAGLVIRLTTIGSDGANTDGRITAFRPEYMEVYAYPNSPGPLQTGDRVVAVDGVTMREWAVRLFTPNSERVTFTPNTMAIYQIVRRGEPLTLLVGLKYMSFVSVFQTRWGFFIFIIVSQLLATWLLIRRPQLAAARAFFIWSMLGSQMYLWALPLGVGDVVTGYGFWLGRFVVAGMALLFYPALLHFALLYPRTPGFVQRHAWLPPLLYLGSIVLYFAIISYFWASAPTVLSALSASNRAVGVVSIVYLLAALAAIILQYRHAAPGPDRQRAKWGLLGGSIALVSGLVIGVLTPLMIGYTGVDINLYGLTLLAFPVSMTIAMWRYHLFDVDLIIRKTFLYVIVTAILVMAYLGAIIFLEAFFRQFTRQNSRPAVALATAAIMLLFNPVRVRVQASIDRHFYRTSYDPTQAFTRFAAATRDEADLPKLLATLESTINGSLQPASIHIWLAPRRKVEEAEQE